MILVTGATGFVGSALVDRLAAYGLAVRGGAPEMGPGGENCLFLEKGRE